MIALFIIILPFFGTAIGSAAVFFCKKRPSVLNAKMLSGFAAGVMLAAGVWSLILPSLELSSSQIFPLWVPATLGFIMGIVFLLLTEKTAGRLTEKRPKSEMSENFILFFAVTLHNIPEGMAVGVAVAGMLNDRSGITAAAALALSFGIGVQNLPEGAIISMPALAKNGKLKSFLYGLLSGAVEPVAAAVTVFFVSRIIALLPYILSFAAGAMFYVTVEDLIPESKADTKSGFTAFFCSAGFLLMMILDVCFG